MYLVYQILKVIARIALWIYYPRTTIVNREHLRFKGPAILISNHQNTLMDALNAAAHAREQVFFLANAGLFRSKFSDWFFNTFFCIPIKRTVDADGKPVDNEQNFARVNAHLEGGGTIYIAPEGTSWMRRHLYRFKTGTARIAFSAERKNDYQLDLKIIPVGLNYTNYTQFRSGVFIFADEPIYVRDWREDYEKDPVETVKRVTAELQERIRALMIDTADDAEDLFLRRLEEMLQNSKPLDLEKHFHRTKKLLANLRIWQNTERETYDHFYERVTAYFQHLKQNKISDNAVVRTPDRGLALKFFGLMLGLPLFLYGYLNNFLPAFIPAATNRWLQRKYDLYIGYTSTVKISTGVFTFPIFYWLQSELVQALFSTPISWWYLLSLPITGWFALQYQTLARKVFTRMRLQTLAQDKFVHLKTERMQLFDQLQEQIISR
jgi:1-acyl-sn-glycerol-3-phosphate acyltransferase